MTTSVVGAVLTAAVSVIFSKFGVADAFAKRSCLQMRIGSTSSESDDSEGSSVDGKAS